MRGTDQKNVKWAWNKIIQLLFSLFILIYMTPELRHSRVIGITRH